MLRFSICVLLFFISTAAAKADPIKFVRYPHISNGGQIAFSYHGDIWVADSDGTNARRLTAHIARDTFPRFSPDGKWIAFNSDRMGNTDIWVVPVSGGAPRQLTHHSTSDSIQYWTPDGKGIIAATSRGSAPWGSPLHVIPIDGGMPQPLNMDRGAAGMISQNGKLIAFNRNGFRYWRKHYRGNNNTDIWVQNLATKEIKQLTDTNTKDYRKHTQDAHPMWGADGQIYFMSERDDTFNIWKISPNGGKPIQVTAHKSDGVQYPSISPDGKTIIYENEFELWKLSVAGGNPQKISIDLSFDPKDNLVHVVNSDSEARGMSPAPNAETIAVEYHGEIFMVPTDPDLGEKVQVTRSEWRDRNPSFSPNGELLAYLSDQAGDEDIWLYDVKTRNHRQLTKQASLKGGMTWSHDSSQLAFTADQKIFLVDVTDGKLTELIHNPEGGFRGVTFSADNDWLCYYRSDQDLNSEVYLFDLKNRKEHNVTQSRFSEFGNTLTSDGKHVVFISNRSGVYQLYAVSLAKLTENLDDPMVKASKKSKKVSGADKPAEKSTDKKPVDKTENASDEDKPKQGGGDSDNNKKKEQPKPESKPLEIHLDGIMDRARQLTSGSDDIRGYEASTDGRTIYFSRGGSLYSVGLAGGKEKKITDGSFSDLTLSGDGKSFFYRSGSSLYKMSTRGSDKKKIEFSLRILVDQTKQWEQIFEEAWRVMKYRFYDKKMHGYDWEKIKARYKPMLKYVGENQDLYDLCNEMIGELNASHTGVSGPPTRSMESLYSTRHLGFELKSDGEYYRVTHIYPKGPADKEWLDLKVGDIVLSIEGKPIRGQDNYFSILNNLLNDYANLTVSTPVKMDGRQAAGGAIALGPQRKLRIRHISSVRNLKYEAWVEGNRKYVNKISGGKVGYVHIRSMNRSSLERFRTEIDQFWNKNGMIIDIRYNGGGNIDQELIDILERRPYEYWNSRQGGRARGRRPRQAIAGPKVMLINWRSASDSEVTPQAFRDLKLGRIVGNPTYGAVIATGSYRLMGGARIRTPGSLVVTYDPSRKFNYGINLENFGVAPDVWVENTPADELRGFDRELKTAVDEALKMLKEGSWQYGEDD